MSFYTVYGLTIQSELALPELPPAAPTTEPDVTVRVAQATQTAPAINYQQKADTFMLESDGGKYVITAARQITIFPDEGSTEDTWRVVLLGQVLAAVLRLKEKLVLHASAIATEEGVVAFLGNSGWGKSTLVDSLYMRGYYFVTDDVLPLEMSLNPPLVYPGFPQVKLTAEATASLGHAELPRLSVDIPKYAHRFEERVRTEPLPLKRLYLLGPNHSEHQLQRLNERGAFLNLVQHTHAASIPTRPDLNTLHFKYCTQLISMVPVVLLKRKYSLEALPALVDMIIADFSA